MTDKPYQRWLCDACGYIYDEAKGDPDSGLAPGTRYDDIPDDWECPLCGLRKSDLSLLAEKPAISSTPKKAKFSSSSKKTNRGSDQTVVIVGAGIAGWSVAESIRELDADIPVLLITACEGLSYPKPALSTACAQGKSAQDLVEMDAQSKADSLAIDVRTETRLLKIDSQKKRITTSKGGIQYAKLVLALGAHQRQLPIEGDAAERIVRVNDLKSYARMREGLTESVKHITVLGAGLIGCEFAEDLSTAGYQVSIVDPGPAPLSTLLDAEEVAGLQDSLSKKGVEWKFTSTVGRLDNEKDRMRVSLSSGEQFETDVVISAAGLQVNTEVAAKAGLDTGRGILTNRLMQTSDTDIYSIGDCAEVDGEIYAYIEPIRRQAQVIAENLFGGEKSFESRSPLIRVKTPSFPLSLCLPSAALRKQARKIHVDDSRTEFVVDDKLVGFILTGKQVSGASEMYRKVNQ